jgi:hypothetical protein
MISFAPGWRFLRPVLDAYFTTGRQELRALGTPVVVGHRFAGGFAVCDLVVGDALIDIKCVTQPVAHLVGWIDQLLRYVLLDFADELGIRRTGIYFARHALLLTEPIDALLARVVVASRMAVVHPHVTASLPLPLVALETLTLK